MAVNGFTLPKSDLPILIVGAGIAGLVLGQGLRIHKVPFRIFERHPLSHSSQGHRLRISQDSIDALNSVLPERLTNLFDRTRSDEVKWKPRIVDARTFEFPPRREESRSSRTTPIDRTWIRNLLTLGIEDAIEYERAFLSYQVTDDGVKVSFTDGASVLGSLLVGADGLKSQVRRQLQPNRRLLHLESQITWGRMPLTPQLQAQIPDDVLTWFMAIDKDTKYPAICDPMTWSESVHERSYGQLPDFESYIYFALATAPPEPQPKSTEEKRSFVHDTAAEWHPTLKLLLNSASHDRSACVPVLSSKPDIEISSKRDAKVTLIGDAAHAMSQMGGVGGDAAIRNAADLAHTIAREGPKMESIQGFEERMSALAKKKIEHSFKGSQKLWGGKEWYEYEEVEV